VCHDFSFVLNRSACISRSTYNGVFEKRNLDERNLVQRNDREGSRACFSRERREVLSLYCRATLLERFVIPWMESCVSVRLRRYPYKLSDDMSHMCMISSLDILTFLSLSFCSRSRSRRLFFEERLLPFCRASSGLPFLNKRNFK